MTRREEGNPPRLWSGARKTPKAASLSQSRVPWPLDDGTSEAGLLRTRGRGGEEAGILKPSGSVLCKDSRS